VIGLSEKGAIALKDVESTLISELMKNSRRSDRELAKAIGVSQPTVSRLVKKLEKKGVIKEYTIIPDFRKLGYKIMGATFIELREPLDKQKLKEIERMTVQIEKNKPHASLMAVSGLDRDKNRLFITFYENYSAYVEAMKLTKNLPFANVDSMESFLVDLDDETNYRLLSMSAIARHLKERRKSDRGSHEKK
jgi:DNA-binding Lrp family transcriptional regulator